MSASNMDYIFYQFLSFSYMSRDLKFAWREVCIIDVGYIVNHFCFMLVIEVVGMLWDLNLCQRIGLCCDCCEVIIRDITVILQQMAVLGTTNSQLRQLTIEKGGRRIVPLYYRRCVIIVDH